MLQEKLGMQQTNFPKTKLLIMLCSCVLSAYTHATIPEFKIVLQDHVFTPSELVIPANKKVKLVIENKDDSAEEFDSFDLNRERVIFANSKRSIYLGPLPPGVYEFFGEFHPNSAVGRIVVKQDIQMTKDFTEQKKETPSDF